MPWFLISILLSLGSQDAPPFLSQLEGRPSPPASPAEAPHDWLLAFVDVETTGLLPGYHEMVDIGMVLTDVEGREIDRLFVRIQPEHPERASEGARAVNAFDPARWRELGALSPKEAVARIVSFHERAAGNRSVLLVAFNSHFDAAFIDHLFRAQGRTWRELYYYYVLDLPSMAWSLGLRHLDGSALTKALGIADEPHVASEHTGLTGAEVNVRVYRALLERRADR
ncbi:MAG TPA: 3'-5' exonuclease [Vicinamibacteria bacterium]|jgi:DNA polymerase III alpha subunit (gram-positive type)